MSVAQEKIAGKNVYSYSTLVTLAVVISRSEISRWRSEQGLCYPCSSFFCHREERGRRGDLGGEALRLPRPSAEGLAMTPGTLPNVTL